MCGFARKRAETPHACQQSCVACSNMLQKSCPGMACSQNRYAVLIWNNEHPACVSHSLDMPANQVQEMQPMKRYIIFTTKYRMDDDPVKLLHCFSSQGHSQAIHELSQQSSECIRQRHDVAVSATAKKIQNVTLVPYQVYENYNYGTCAQNSYHQKWPEVAG